MTGNNEFLEGKVVCSVFNRCKLSKKAKKSEGNCCKCTQTLLYHWRTFPTGFTPSLLATLSHQMAIALGVRGCPWLEETTACVHFITREDPPITFWFLSLEHGELGLYKCAWWILKLLIIKQKSKWVRVWALARWIWAKWSETHTDRHYMGNECWLPFFTRDRQPNMVWVGNNEPVARFQRKKITEGNVSSSLVPKKQSANKCYHNSLLSA